MKIKDTDDIKLKALKMRLLGGKYSDIAKTLGIDQKDAVQYCQDYAMNIKAMYMRIKRERDRADELAAKQISPEIKQYIQSLTDRIEQQQQVINDLKRQSLYEIAHEAHRCDQSSIAATTPEVLERAAQDAANMIGMKPELEDILP